MTKLRSTADQDTILYEVLNASILLTSNLSGEIYKGSRPDDSKLEDITINTLSLQGESTQIGVSNVNIYVPDIQIKKNNTTHTVRNHKRIEQVFNLVEPLVRETYGDNFAFWLTDSPIVKDSDTGQHYMNLRIQFEFDNAV